MAIDDGELRNKIEIQEYKETMNDNCGVEYTYTTIYTLRAKKKTISTKEYIESDSKSTKYTLKFICRKRDITNKHFLLYKKDRYNIKHVHEFEDDSYIELTVERIV
ncbi:phage head closure protein [Romboutsia sedimentorum]|uniref:phage head closure protein n=1 Tax=Romboutsia sedimentorum TaxID=1368474 RepID=UPI0024DEBEFB|nr:phage head closure protein [Romboutsia sedimentorum]MDK2587477.1 phage head closure protein [Romboutsia sedimentorum]